MCDLMIQGQWGRGLGLGGDDERGNLASVEIFD
jgi:hypothetical protein